MEVLKILDEMEDKLEKSPRIPMTGKVVLEIDLLYGFIDKIRSVIPEEIRQAQWVSKERERMLDEAKKEAEGLLSEAQEKTLKIADESQIMKEAHAMAKALVEEAQKKAEEIQRGANEYAFEMLTGLEDVMTKNINVIRKGKSELRNIKDEQ
ncbi:MAG: ATPase [Clostridia bacterium]|nr:ATPase [Clostridia bacterium]